MLDATIPTLFGPKTVAGALAILLLGEFGLWYRVSTVEDRLGRMEQRIDARFQQVNENRSKIN